METVKKIINFTIAILAILICFQIITTNNNKLFPPEMYGIKECRTDIVSTLENKKQYINYNSYAEETEPNS